MERMNNYKILRNKKSKYDNINNDMLKNWIENHLRINKDIQEMKIEDSTIKDLEKMIYDNIEKQLNEAIERLQKKE